MNITEIRTKLVNDPVERLRAFCSITIDGDFVIRDLKVIDGPNGPFLAMPSRKLADRCPQCGGKNHLRAKHCNECGARLPDNRAPKDAQGRAKLHADVAHPINAACRERIQKVVVEAFKAELERSKQPGYKPVDYDAMGDEEEAACAPKPPSEDQPAVTADAERDRRPDTADSDYDSLIADLKREAAERKQQPSAPPGARRPDQSRRAEPAHLPESAASGAEHGAGRPRKRRRPRHRREPEPAETQTRQEPPGAEAPSVQTSPTPPAPKPPDTKKEDAAAGEPPEPDPLSDFGVGIL